MSNELKMVEYQSISGIPVKLDADTVIQYCARGNGNITPQEVALFLRTCQAKRLDPLENGEVYLIKYDNTKPAQIVVGKLSTPTGKCHFSPEWNVIFWRSACGGYAALITRYLSA